MFRSAACPASETRSTRRMSVRRSLSFNQHLRIFRAGHQRASIVHAADSSDTGGGAARALRLMSAAPAERRQPSERRSERDSGFDATSSQRTDMAATMDPAAMIQTKPWLTVSPELEASEMADWAKGLPMGKEDDAGSVAGSESSAGTPGGVVRRGACKGPVLRKLGQAFEWVRRSYAATDGAIGPGSLVVRGAKAVGEGSDPCWGVACLLPV